jgi:aconitate hydratase
MGLNVAQKLIKSHLLSGAMTAGKEIGIRIDQTLTQDATGTLVMLELESMGLDSARTELSCQYVDHNLSICGIHDQSGRQQPVYQEAAEVS